MQPRLKSSTKWTALPSEVATQIKNVFEENFQKELGQSRVIVEGRLYPQEILLRVGYAEPGRLSQNNFEISMDYQPENENAALSTIHVCVDVAASLLAEHFESASEIDSEIEFPRVWTEFPFDDFKVWLQFSSENSELEKKANEILGDWDDSMVQDEVADDEADDNDDSGTNDDEGSGSSGGSGPTTLH